MASPYPILAVVGRPNVGKSTFFNRVAGERLAVVEDLPGVTRDRNYRLIEHFSVPFYLVDTGGFEKDPSEELQELVAEQARLAAEEADVVIAIFDCKLGLQPGDHDVVELLRRYDKPILFAANKCDGKEHEPQAAEFYSLGVDEIFTFSALHGRGVRNFIEEALSRLPNYSRLLTEAEAREARIVEAKAAAEADIRRVEQELKEAEEQYKEERYVQPEKRPAPEAPDFAPVFLPGESEEDAEDYERRHAVISLSDGNTMRRAEAEEEETAEPEEQVLLPEVIRVAIIGRPNVGKSTLLNTLTGSDRAITSPIAGTTRDSLHQEITRDGQRYMLVDTAGLRKKARVSDKVEHYSTIRALNALSECDVAVMMLNAEEGPTEQDAKILGLAHEQGKGIIIAVNKWDAIEKSHTSVQKFRKEVEATFKFIPYAPMVFISALTGRRCPKVIEAVHEVASARLKRVSTRHLNKLLRAAASRVGATSYRGRPVRLLYAAQVDTAPPRFMLVFNYPRQVHFSFLRFLKNSIRERYGFEGTDIKFVLRKR